MDFGKDLVVDSLEVVVDPLVDEDGICDEWRVRDYLGSVRAFVGIGNYITGIRELNTYLTFGTRIPGSRRHDSRPGRPVHYTPLLLRQVRSRDTDVRERCFGLGVALRHQV